MDQYCTYLQVVTAQHLSIVVKMLHLCSFDSCLDYFSLAIWICHICSIQFIVRAGAENTMIYVTAAPTS